MQLLSKEFQLSKRRFISASALAICGLMLSSCGQKQATTTTATSDQASTTTSAAGIVVGFSQIGAESGWRTANTKSIKDEAAKRGIDLQFSDAQQKQENQIKAIRSFAAQGVDVIAFSPVVETGWEPVLREVKKAGIPVILTDRAVDVTDETLYKTFIGSDFVEEGRRAGLAIDRQKGFAEVIAKYPNMKVVKSQSGDFTRAKGKEVMESFLKSSEGNQITALFSHNDDMALGAIQAMEEAGKKPGSQIKIVSIDGVKDAFQAMVDGKLNVTVECNPMIGPQLFDAVEKIKAGQSVPRRIESKEGVFEQATAKEDIKTRAY